MTDNDAYSKVVACLLSLKAEGVTDEQLAKAIVRASSEANVMRYHINEAYDTLDI